jgi:quercetin dioxygenase-like cupin family protein
MTEDELRNLAMERGYSEPTHKEFEPNLLSELHAHDFAVLGLVTRGTLRLAYQDGREDTFVTGQYCDLPSGTLHSERTNEEGATFYLAVK